MITHACDRQQGKPRRKITLSFWYRKYSRNDWFSLIPGGRTNPSLVAVGLTCFAGLYIISFRPNYNPGSLSAWSAWDAPVGRNNDHAPLSAALVPRPSAPRTRSPEHRPQGSTFPVGNAGCVGRATHRGHQTRWSRCAAWSRSLAAVAAALSPARSTQFTSYGALYDAPTSVSCAPLYHCATAQLTQTTAALLLLHTPHHLGPPNRTGTVQHSRWVTVNASTKPAQWI